MIAVRRLNHAVLFVSDVDELAAAREVLVAAGAFGGESSHGATKSLYGADPDGNEFEIMWRVPREAWGEAEHKGAILPLDLDAELKRFGSGAPS